jgi:glycosyltransferase involved in cell wall biosynthesis
VTAVHQLVASFAPRDATGNYALRVQGLLRAMGFESEIWVGEASREVARLSRSFTAYRGSKGQPTWWLYQASTGSRVADWLVTRPEPKLLCYHNITPPALFGPWEPHVGVELELGRRQMRELAPLTELAIAMSTYNETDLRRLGYRSTTVVPFLLDTAAFGREVDEPLLARLREESGPVWLAVGRLAPHKAQHVLVKALAVHHRLHGPGARLRIVGTPASGRYRDALLAYRDELGLADAVTIVGDISDAALTAHYRAADVYVGASLHEGFGVPLLEAMHHGLPVVAVGSSAVPETMGGAGLCLPTSDAAVLAAAAHRAVDDPVLRTRLVEAGRRRLAEIDLATAERRFTDAVASVVAA